MSSKITRLTAKLLTIDDFFNDLEDGIAKIKGRLSDHDKRICLLENSKKYELDLVEEKIKNLVLKLGVGKG